VRDRLPIVLSALALAIAILGVSGPAIAHGVQHALFAHNAGKLQGRHANELLRAGKFMFSSSDFNFTSTDFDSIGGVEAKAPTRGILLVWGTIDARAVAAAPPAVLEARIRMRGRSTVRQTLSLQDNGNEAGSISVSGAIPVGKGERLIKLEAYLSQGTEVSIRGRSLVTLFVPFGNHGKVGEL